MLDQDDALLDRMTLCADAAYVARNLNLGDEAYRAYEFWLFPGDDRETALQKWAERQTKKAQSAGAAEG